MSDIPEDIVAATQSRDRRFKAISLGIEVEAGLRDSGPIRILMERLRQDADEAMTAFSVANPADYALICDLQAQVFRFRYIYETLNAILAAGQTAEQDLRMEDRAEETTADDIRDTF